MVVSAILYLFGDAPLPPGSILGCRDGKVPSRFRTSSQGYSGKCYYRNTCRDWHDFVRARAQAGRIVLCARILYLFIIFTFAMSTGNSSAYYFLGICTITASDHNEKYQLDLGCALHVLALDHCDWGTPATPGGYSHLEVLK